MKVYIGPYPNYNKKTKKHPDRKVRVQIHGYDAWNADHTLALIILPILKLLQKNKHGAPYTDDEDAPEKLRSTCDKSKREEWETDKLFFKRWDWILNEMIWAFEQKVNDDGDSKYYSGKHDTYWQALDKNHKPIGKPVKWKDKKKHPIKDDGTLHVAWEMVKGPKDTFKVDHKGLEAHYARMKNGFRLFGKYYQGLWD